MPSLPLIGSTQRRFWRGVTGAVLLAMAGCRGAAPLPPEALAERILAPADASPQLPELPEPPRPADARDPVLPPPRLLDEPGAAKPAEEAASSEETICLKDAIDFALRNNPRLRVARAAIDQARGRKEAAFAPFLPQLATNNRVVTGDSQLQNIRIDTEPVTGFGNSHQTFSQIELALQWTLYDFGRTGGRFAQAGLNVDITQLQLARADQAVAFDVSTAYYRLLFSRATRVVARQSVRRAESVLELTRNLFTNGVIDRDSVLRAEVQLAEMRQLLVAAESAEHVAQATLNYAMGRNVSGPATAADVGTEPPFEQTLPGALELALGNRRELAIAAKAVEVADQGVRVAHAEFKPRLYTKGNLDYVSGGGIQTGYTQFVGLHLDCSLFEGGRRLGDLRAAGADVRAAVARAQQVGDTVALEVNQAYWAVDDARQRIVLSRTAIAQARENLRLVLNKYRAGDATPTDVVDAETTLTRSQQSFNTALYDYLIALARLDYATGTTSFSNASEKR